MDFTNNHSIKILFSVKHGLPVFGACMPENRFKFLMAHICFDQYSEREARWQRDRFAATRDFFEDCNTNFAKSLIPEDYFSLDETFRTYADPVGIQTIQP